MNDMTARRFALFCIPALAAWLLAGCSRSDQNLVQGYVEGEFVYVASPLPGALQSLPVRRGMQVQTGNVLFALDSTPERAARDEAERRLAQARANLEDVRKGKRPSEIDAIEAQLKQARSVLALAKNEFVRQENLTRTPGATAELEYLRARSARDQAIQRVAELEAGLRTAKLGSRSDQIEAAEANLRALEAALARSKWDLSQKHQTAPQSGLVFDTLYREGEWIPSGRPIVVLLPPRNIKVRAFVPETRIGTIHAGDPVEVRVDGVPDLFSGTVSYISPRAEYTPPVIYSQENRSKLVFLVEALFDPEISVKLHPGQPVDVRFGS
jgi:HlyD family secretion protein